MEEVKDVSTIQDEDVLRRMWQTTEDFSRKKEIRSHMYKLREARLKEFYTTGEVLRDVQRSNSSPGLREQPCVKDEGPTHADSLADHSFLSLKTKEIRDSESPTREVQYKNSKNRDTDGQWTISSKTETSDDGKRITSSQLATTQGVRAIDGGQLAYAAANEHQASVYSDGDANNYTRSMGESSKTFAQENVVSGDENNFRSSKTTSSSSSSKVVTHHSSTTGDFENLAIMDKDSIPEDYAKSSTKVTKTSYTSGDIPDDLKKSIADGNTKVYTETKTLPDGSTVTTTRYETKGTKKFTSGSTTKSSKQVVESSSEINNKHIDNNSRVITTKTREIYDDTPIETETVRITKSEKRIRDDDDNSRFVTTETREIYDESPKTETIKIIKTKQVYDDDYKTNLQNERIIRNDDRKVVTDTKVTRTKEDYVPETKEIYTTVTTETISNVTENEPKYDQPENIPIKSRPKERPQNLEVVKSCKPDESYKPNSPTDGQYSTTYRSEFTNKKISVEVSATHDAFARSLRSISPDRISDRPKSRGSIRTSNSSLRSSTSPDKCPRSSPERKPGYDRSPDQKRPVTSPTKHEYYPERTSPERRRPDTITVTRTTETITRRKPTERISPERPIQNYSPARTPTSPTKTDVTITKTTKVNRNQTSPERPRGSSPIKHTERTSPVKDVNTDTITKRKKIPDDDERKSPVRSPTKTTTEIISTETLTKKKKIPIDDNERKSPVKSPMKTTNSTEIITVNSDTITRRKKIPTDDNECKSPVRSPTKTSTTEITTVNTDTITRKKNVPEDDERKSPVRSPTKNTTITTEVTEINTDTLTRKKKKSPEEPRNGTLINKKSEVTNIESQIVTDIETTKRPTSRDLSPTSLASDIEFINHNRHIVTDLDEPCDIPEKRPTTLNITETVVTKQTKDNKVSKDKNSPTKSPTKDKSSPVKEIPKKYKPTPDLDSPSEKPPTVFNVPDDFEQVCEVVPQESKIKPPLKRTETYEERCRQMLGLPEPDNIPKKEYEDMYAGKEPVEEPLFTKKYVAPLGPEDNLMHDTVEKIKKRRPETEINIEEFIVTERKDILETNKPNDKPKKISSSERKSPQKPKNDGEYITEYTDEYIKKPVPEKSTQDKTPTKSATPVEIKPDTKDKKPIKTSSPDRKSPQRKVPKDNKPTEGEYTTEYVDEYCDKPVTKKPDTTQKKPSSPERKSPQKKSPTDTEYTTEYTTKITTTTDKKSTSPDRKPSREIPEKKPASPERKSPQKKSPTDTEYTTEYITQITNSTDKKSTSPNRKPIKESPEKKASSPERKSPQKKSPTDTEYTTKITHTTDKKSISPNRKPSQPKNEPEDMEFSTEYTDEYCEVTDKYVTTRKPAGKKIEPRTNNISAVPVISSPTKRKPEKVNKSKGPDDSTDEEDIDECTTTEITELNTTEPIKKDFPKEYIPENLPKTNDFISREKYDTDITLTTKKSPSKQPDTEFNLETENTQTTHIRTHRIDKTVEDVTPRETSPRRHPQKAIPSDTMECTFKRTVTEDENIIKKKPEESKTPKKPTKLDDRKSPVKQIIKKDSVPKTTTTVKTITKKLTEIEPKKVQETPKKKSPTERIPKERSPERIKARSPSPINKSVSKRTVVEHNIIRKTSSKDIPIKKTPEKPTKPISTTRTPSESPVRKPTTIPTSITSPERKPQKTTTKSSPISKTTEPTNKHVVTKTIALTNRPDIKSQPASPVKNTPKTITTIKTTKLTQPSSVTVTTVKTTKTTKKTIKPQKPDTDTESDSEAEIIDVSDSRVDRKKVVTTAKIKINNISKQPNVTMPSFKVNTNEVITDNQPTKSDQLTTKCITTKSIVLNHAETEELEFIIDLQRSTSSREPSPDKICPIPVSSEDEGSYPRYPDQVSEPDDQPAHRRPVKVSDIPLNEEEDVKDFNRITEITETIEESSRKPYTRITDIDMVTETDESLLSVTEKVNKFITTAEKLTDDEPKAKTPAPKVPRPELHIDEHLENDECLLSVSDKVSKFITTAEHVAVKTTDRSKSPRPRENTPVEYKVNENDECLLSVNQKVSHFIQAAETSTQKPTTREGPAPKVARPEFNVDETLKTDECLLSVSDKVSKFLTTAEKLTDVRTTKTETIKRESPEKIIPKSPEKYRTSPEKRRESPDKFTKPEIIYKREPSPEKRRESPEKISRPEISYKRDPSPEKSPRKSLETCELPYRPKSELKPAEKTETKPVNLKSSEAVRKAKAMFENISKTQEVPKQRDILSRPSIWEGRKKPEKPEDDVKLTDIGVYKKSEPEIKKKLSYTSDDLNTCKKITTDLKDVALKSTKLILNESNVEKTRYLSPEKDIPGYMRPTSKPSRDEIPETKIYRSRSPNPNGDIPGYMKPISKQTPDEPDRPISRSRSPNPNGEIPGYMKPIHKVSSEERDNNILETRLRETYSPEKLLHHENGDETPHYMLPLQRHQSPERDTHCCTKITKETEIIETVTEKSHTPERDVPGYMKPLQRHAHSPDREERKNVDDDDSPRAAKKFGVTLRRTDSGRMVTTTSTVTERRRSSTPGQPNIEEIQDLEVLERMMDKVVGYEQRRRIRAQIRIVKKLISDNKMQKKTTKIAPSPTRDSSVTKTSSQCEDRKSPVRDTKRAISPAKKTAEPRQKSPDPKPRPSIEKSTFSTVTSTTTQKSERITSTKDRSLSPEPKKRTQTSQMYKTDLKHIQPTNKIVQDDKPSWVTNRNLKKASETVTEKKIISSIKKSEPKRSPSPQKDEKPIDCITSSYGIGPTDENGQPLFGIRALRKAANNKVHIRGTVMTSQLYSENGEEPVGEVTLTKYSNDPNELNIDDEQINKSKGIASITTTQKFGSRGSPTLSSLIDKKKAITDQTEDELFKTTSKVTRRGSVKALSQKFIENAVETSRNEKQTYPKAGLILRTSSFKETNQTTDRNSSRESSPGYQPRGGKVSLDSITSDSRQQTVQDTSSTKTFLNSHTRVANAQEVITRMKNSEKEHIEGDTPEDREARMLLNKFLGAQVLMSGMEPLISAQTMSTTSTSSSQLVRKVQKKTVTSTTKETSKPLSLTKRYQTPITAEVLQDIWDEQTLRALLEQCTDYEERRAIRARLRQVMAEQEAVANVVASAVAEGDRTMQERIETTKKTFSEGPVTTQVSTTRVVQQSKQVSKPISPFAKFRQLDKQNSLNTPPSSPRTPTGTGAPLFKFTDPALSHSASTVKDRLLHWCQMKTKEYQNIKLENFSTSWADGMAFCALIHHFLPDTFDYHALNPKQRRHNFTLAFKVADEQAGIAPLLDVDDMVAMRRPDWKCVFTYVQSIYRRFKDED